MLSRVVDRRTQSECTIVVEVSERRGTLIIDVNVVEGVIVSFP